MSVINQKEYLKKYLSIGKKLGDKKKKKKSRVKGERLKIVDDNIDIQINDQIKVDLEADNDDAPQIVAIIDERPISRQIDEKSNQKLWKPIDESDDELDKQQLNIKEEPDLSPLREKQLDLSPPKKSINDKNNYDLSPPRRRRRKLSNYTPPPPDLEPKQEADLSPPRKSKGSDADTDLSPPRRQRRRQQSTSPSPPRKHQSKSLSSKHDRKHSRHRGGQTPPPLPEKKRQSSRWRSPTPEKLNKTLDGKKAGLQQGADVAIELEKHKKCEDEWFKNLSSDISGAGKSAIVRRKQPAKDPVEKEQQRRHHAEVKAKYDKWGKGLKQVEDANTKRQRDLYEMSKPLARYANDEDLENYLKSQEREGDPMLQYLKNKKRIKSKEMGLTEKPQYEGSSHPNRFAIKPGHRWDGVNRSNGFETKWFESQNNKAANLEESYKWSTEDM